ncbi:hypothetical protein NA56DRAFT_666962 [Hyaloscypha hepaticicola]|uniref:Uncharacterized protein n=1 Tax=Hyaloscypha hepaticicola TaxID=2082293 RepID=A0A2J6QQ24_9HELO|nr:hypothetical protein NA56DRAFT_666962 [Hyaloscypha hepaticicola]
MTSFLSFKGNKLIGRSNYIEWKNNADLFLEINGYMSYINGTEIMPIKEGKETSTYSTEPFTRELGARYADRISEFNDNNKRVLGALKSVISNDNNDCFKDKTSSKDLYNSIIKTFSQTSLELVGCYFDKIVDTNYGSFNNMDEYISNIQLSIIYLIKLNQTISKPIVAWLILKGLPSQYDSYTSRKYEELIEDLDEINVSKLANKTSFNNNQSYYKYCNKKGHIEDKCFIKYPELRNNYFNSNNKTKTSKKYYKSINKPKFIYKKK